LAASSSRLARRSIALDLLLGTPADFDLPRPFPERAVDDDSGASFGAFTPTTGRFGGDEAAGGCSAVAAE
jgi:hypothetical protein